MKISKEIQNAIRKASEDCGNVYQLSKKIGVSHSTVLFWLNGKTSNMSGDIWYEKLLPVIKPYLPENGSMRLSDSAAPYLSRSEVSAAGNMTAVPVINAAQAACYEPALEPIDDFAKGCSDETAVFASEIKEGYFALQVEGDSMTPNFPDGTVLLVAGGEFAERGDVVVAKIRETGQVVVKKYSRRNNIIRLESINPKGQNFEWNCKENPGFIQWMYPVLEANINLRKQRWANHTYI